MTWSIYLSRPTCQRGSFLFSSPQGSLSSLLPTARERKQALSYHRTWTLKDAKAIPPPKKPLFCHISHLYLYHQYYVTLLHHFKGWTKLFQLKQESWTECNDILVPQRPSDRLCHWRLMKPILCPQFELMWKKEEISVAKATMLFSKWGVSHLASHLQGCFSSLTNTWALLGYQDEGQLDSGMEVFTTFNLSFC